MNIQMMMILWFVAMIASLLGSQTSSAQESNTIAADQVTELMIEGPQAYTLEEAQNAADEVLPMIETATGRRFKSKPHIVIADREKLNEVLKADLRPQFRQLLPQLSQEQLESQVKAAVTILTPAMLGKYGFSDGNLYLLPKNVEPLFKLARVDKKFTGSIIKLVIAHELTHALQDQYVGLSRMAESMKTMEKSQAFSATIEGHAVFVQDEIGRSLKLEESAVELARAMSAGAISIDDPALDMIAKVVDTQFEQIYLRGRDFITYHHGRGGNEKIWEILENPPPSTSMISSPETYAIRVAQKVDYHSVLQNLEERLGDQTWQVQNLELGELALRSAYANMDAETREVILKKISHAQALIATAPGSMAHISLIELNDPTYTTQLVHSLEMLGKSNIERLRTGSLFIVSDFNVEEFPAIKGDVSRKLYFTLTAQGNNSRFVIYRIGRGPLLVEMLFQNHEMSDTSITQIAELVFDRHAQLTRKAPDQ